MRPFISISSDFGAGTKGNGIMYGTAVKICPEARIIELATNIQGFGILQGARIFESIKWLPVGCHVIVVDPGVGTKRRAIVIETGRGDYLVGPDNGVMLPAAKFVGRIKRVFEITNQDFMQKPVSPIFHGRDVFISTAAHLACGKKVEDVGNKIKEEDLVPAPYKNAVFKDGKIECTVIDRNIYGNLFLNILAETIHEMAEVEDLIIAEVNGKKIELPYRKTFGEVAEGKQFILDDDFNRVEIAINLGNFSEKFGVKPGDKLILKKK